MDLSSNFDLLRFIRAAFAEIVFSLFCDLIGLQVQLHRVHNHPGGVFFTLLFAIFISIAIAIFTHLNKASHYDETKRLRLQRFTHFVMGLE